MAKVDVTEFTLLEAASLLGLDSGHLRNLGRLDRLCPAPDLPAWRVGDKIQILTSALEARRGLARGENPYAELDRLDAEADAAHEREAARVNAIRAEENRRINEAARQSRGDDRPAGAAWAI
jgi:hypothetical protein